ncbi:MAG: hypothetical protein K6T78_08775 [Alicyclobacillus sp.]|nr:hypothetical protein [Alicyclobacillus sp.]
MTKAADNETSHHDLQSVDSGGYNPGPLDPHDNQELSYVQAQQDDILLEEFPEGPYGSSRSEPVKGKSTPWEPGQRAISAYRDQNPVFSDRKVPLDEPPTHGQPRGSIEGQN